MTDNEFTVTHDDKDGYVGKLHFEQTIKIQFPLRIQLLLFWLALEFICMCVLMFSILEKLNKMVG